MKSLLASRRGFDPDLTPPTVTLWVQVIACVLVSLYGVLIVRSTNPAQVYGLSWALTGAIAWALWSWWRVTTTLFDPYGMFLISLFLFNGGQALLENVGLNDGGLLRGRFDDQTLIVTLYMSLLALNFTHLGALVAARRRRLASSASSSTADRQALRATGWGLLAISAVPSAIVLWGAVRTTVAAGYMALYQRDSVTGASAGPQVVAMFMVPAAMFLIAGANGRRREKWTAVAVITAHTITQLFLGYRSSAIMPACALAWLWHRSEHKIRARWLLGTAILMAAVIIPISRDTRSVSGRDRTSLDTFLTSYASLNNPLVSTIAEMGGSMATIAHTYNLVPGTRAYDRGTSYAYAALTVVPNLFWDVHPTIAHRTLQDWLVWVVDPYSAARGGSLGFSAVAEAYLNFGWMGVPLVMGLVGFGMGRLATWASGCTNPRRLAMAAAFTAFVLKFPRDETASLVRLFTWYCWTPYIIATLIAALGTRQAILTAQRLMGLGPQASGVRSL